MNLKFKLFMSLLLLLVSVILYFLLFINILNINDNKSFLAISKRESRYEDKKEICAVKVLPRLSRPYSIWLWDMNKINSYDLRRKIFCFLTVNNINTIYLRIDDYVDIWEGKKYDEEKIFIDQLNAFINEAHRNNIKVEALFGASQWGNSSHRYLVDALMNFIIQNYKQGILSFDGIHIDIEPHGQKDFDKHRKKYYLSYLTTIDKNIIQRLLQEHIDMTVSIDIPFWYNNDNTREYIWYNNQLLTVAQHLFYILSKYSQANVVLMAYRDVALGKNGVVNSINDEFSFLSDKKININIFIAQEFTKQNPDNISYYGRNWEYVSQQLQIIDKYYIQHDTYKKFYQGIALHSLSLFMCAQNKEKVLCIDDN